MKKLFWFSGALLCFALQSTAHAQSQRADVLVALNGTSSIVDLDLGGADSELDLLPGSNLIIQTEDVTCVTIGCTAQLVYLRATFADFSSVVRADGDEIGLVNFESPTVTVAGPISMVRGPLGFVVQDGVTVSFSGVMTGELNGTTIPRQPAAGLGKTTASMLIGLSVVPIQLLTIDAIFPFTLKGTGLVDGDPVEINLPGSVRIQASGVTPFANVPPTAVAKAPASVPCGAYLNLDASGSFDPNDDIVEYRWLNEDGEVLATGETASIIAGSGTRELTLEVLDELGGVGRDTFIVEVASSDPVFTFVPPDITAPSCGALKIGQATAKSCGTPITPTHDAPSFFYGGQTTVTWTATSGGKSVTETQRVLVMPNDDAACCPPGSYVILGTPNNDVLNGTAGRDCILGRNGQDIINGGGGDDIISGGEGDDQISGGLGNDVVNAGNGQDKVFGNVGDDALFGGGGDDRVEAGPGNDLLGGGQGQDKLYGGDGNDEVLGNDGDDQLFGEAGDDLLDGGENNDQCTGGPGTDQFLSCMILDQQDTPPPGGGAEDFNVCECRPNKCTDCSSGVQTCNNTAGCRSILDCVHDEPSCNLPHECAATCENGQSQAAINAARSLASCFGGC